MKSQSESDASNVSPRGPRHDRPAQNENHRLPILAIVGRPNVGKSTLFNRIVGRRVAIVHEEPGVTRDRVSSVTRWNDKAFEVIDTGGIAFVEDEKTADVIGAAIKRQAEVAIELANAIIMVVDVTAGITPLDLEIVRKLRSSGKPVILAVNKVDNNQREGGVDEFNQLGLKQIFSIAAVHGIGVREMVDQAIADFPVSPEEAGSTAPRIAIVGKPNAGKSSLLNAILQSDRTIVSEVPGTTRDSVDVPFTLKQGAKETKFVLVDTAGLRHRSKIRTSVDQFGLMRAERSIRECDMAVLVLDAAEGVTGQDKRIGGMIAEAGRGCVILVNKWDLAKDQERQSALAISRDADKKKHRAAAEAPKTFREEYLEAIRKELFFLSWAPVLFASAKTGERVDELFRLLGQVQLAMERRVETPRLNQLVIRALESYPPPMVQGRRLRIYYALQKSSRPPTFTMFVNNRASVTPHYERFLVEKIRAVWEFTGCPVRLQYRERERRKFHRKITEK